MLTVKKFLNVFDLSVGGYAAGVFGLLWALLTIFEFPPDMDLQDDKADNETETIASVIATTAASVLSTDPNDEDEPIPLKERVDELNDVLVGVNITLIFIGWILIIASCLCIYGTFKRQSRMLVPFMFALLQAVSLVILLEFLPEFIDDLGAGWFILINVTLAITTYLMMVVYSLYWEFYEEELNKTNLYSTRAFH